MLMASRYVSMIIAAVMMHPTAGGTPKASSVCGITVEQSPSGKPNAKAKVNGLGVSAQLVRGEEGGDGGTRRGKGLESGGEGDEFVPTHRTPTSSWCPQLWDPNRSHLHSLSSASVPEQPVMWFLVPSTTIGYPLLAPLALYSSPPVLPSERQTTAARFFPPATLTYALLQLAEPPPTGSLQSVTSSHTVPQLLLCHVKSSPSILGPV